MKPTIPYLALILSSLSFSAAGAERESAPSRPGTPVYQGISEVKMQKTDGSQGTLQVLLTIPAVKSQYDNCVKEKVDIEKIPDCIWNGDGGNVKKLSDDIRKQVSEVYAAEANKKDPTRAPASEAEGEKKTSGLTNKSKNIAIDYMSDPAVIELSKVFQKKLQSALTGDEKTKDPKTIASVDHAKFIDLYKTELGKTIVNSFTSYCMESNIDYDVKTLASDCEDEDKKKVACPIYLLHADKSKAVRQNVGSLKGADLSSGASANKWTGCIASVSRVCYTDSSKLTILDQDEVDFARSKMQACLIMDYVKSARKNLIAADEQKDFYDKLAKENAGAVKLGVMNAKAVEITEKNNMDAVTTMTSKEVENSYEKANKEVVQKEMDQCIDATGKVKNTDACQKFIEADPEEKKKALAEFTLRQYALEENLKEKLNDDGEVKKYLKEEGYDDKKIAEIASNPKDLEKIRQEIKDRYSAERQAIIAAMADKIKSKTTAGQGVDASKDSTKLGEIRNDIANRPEDLKQLVHFSNVVSSYLEIDTGGKKTRNIASLYAEINNTGKMANVDKDAAEEIKKNAEKAGLKENKGKGDTKTDLSVDTLNRILKYSSEK